MSSKALLDRQVARMRIRRKNRAMVRDDFARRAPLHGLGAAPMSTYCAHFFSERHAKCMTEGTVTNSEAVMLSWAITFLVIAIIAAVFGFGGVAAGAAGIAKVLFFLFVLAFVVSLFMHMRGGGRGPRV
jgi:uncharacterized membrane protein YtjA (UPF0391 family)